MSTIVNHSIDIQKPKKWNRFFHDHLELIMAITSGLIILTAWLLGNYIPQSMEIILYLSAFIIGGYHQGMEGITDTIEKKELNVELLMVIAAIGAASIGYWIEGAILIVIFAFAGALETYTMNKSKNEISALMTLQPEEARIIENGIESFIPVSQLQIGDTILVKASERIPADGLIIKGNTSIDESALTGESIPVNKIKADEVFAGTVAIDGTITVQITKQASETVFQKIIHMVQTAKDEKAPVQLFIERFEGRYVQVVLIVVALMMFVPYLFLGWPLTESIYRAMILLVVASPCALVASVMPAALSMISTSAKNGVLFKGAVHAEMLSQIKTMAFDKTGTLTKGMPVVTDFHILSEYDADEVHEIVGLIERESMHPLAKAITDYTTAASGKIRSSKKLTEVKTINGRGIKGTVNGSLWFIGKKDQKHEQSYFQEVTASLEKAGKTIVYITHEDKVIAVYGLKDTIREEAIDAIQELKRQGIYTIMLTGDNEQTAKAIANEAGIDDFVADCMPENKAAHIKQLMNTHGKTAMIGDGINDAPALATANIGIAMGEGTDAAMETADMVLMKNELPKIMHALKKSKKMNRIIKQNIAFSITIICLLILSNFTQLIDMPLGVIGHEGSTILVILNGLRLLK